MDKVDDITPAREKTRLRRVHGSVARKLGMAIVSGEHRPGDTLPGEVEASQDLHVSRSAYREAIRMLAAKGLVESKPKIGTRINPSSRWNLLDPDVLGWLFEGEPTEALIESLHELRLIVEPSAAAFAAQRRSLEQLERMRSALITMQARTLATPAGQAADRAFHDAVLEATGNAPLFALSSSIGAAVRWTTVFKQRQRGLPRDPMPEHWSVFDAIAAQRPDQAREAMERLVCLALEDTRASLKHGS